MRIIPVESPRIPEQGSSSQGKSGPKARPKGVVDGQQVEIPVLQERSTDAEGKVERVNGRTRPSNKPEYTGKSVYSLT